MDHLPSLNALPDLQIQLGTSPKPFDFRYLTNFDAAITYGRPVGGRDLASSTRPLNTIEDLSRHCILHSSADRDGWKAWTHRAGIQEFRSAGSQSFELEESSIQATKLGSGISLVNLYFVQEELANGTLMLPFPDMPPLPMHVYYLVYQKNKSLRGSFITFKNWLFQERDAFLDRTRISGHVKPDSSQPPMPATRPMENEVISPGPSWLSMSKNIPTTRSVTLQRLNAGSSNEYR